MTFLPLRGLVLLLFVRLAILVLFSIHLAILLSYRHFCLLVMVAQALDLARETYFAILMDRSFNGPGMVGYP